MNENNNSNQTPKNPLNSELSPLSQRENDFKSPHFYRLDEAISKFISDLQQDNYADLRPWKEFIETSSSFDPYEFYLDQILVEQNETILQREFLTLYESQITEIVRHAFTCKLADYTAENNITVLSANAENLRSFWQIKTHTINYTFRLITISIIDICHEIGLTFDSLIPGIDIYEIIQSITQKYISDQIELMSTGFSSKSDLVNI